ncbi:hypothetical protein BH11ACT8_BH11ACT8_35370 [soil metagenome]
MIARVGTCVVVLGLAAVLALLGRWGRAHAHSLTPTSFPERDRDRRAAAVRRGGIVCYAASAVMAVVGVLAVV